MAFPSPWSLVTVQEAVLRPVSRKSLAYLMALPSGLDGSKKSCFGFLATVACKQRG